MPRKTSMMRVRAISWRRFPIANTLRGERLHLLTGPGRYRAVTALLLLAPETPMLFMGQEFAASAPFLYFADHTPELQRLVIKGRKRFLSQFPSYATASAQRDIPDSGLPSTFERCQLDFSERVNHAPLYRFHQELLRLRREDAVMGAPSRRHLDGAVLSREALVIRWAGGQHADRLLVINLGHDLDYRSAPEPLLAPPEGSSWELVWSSDDPRYGGSGILHPCGRKGWRFPGESAIVLRAAPSSSRRLS